MKKRKYKKIQMFSDIILPSTFAIVFGIFTIYHFFFYMKTAEYVHLSLVMNFFIFFSIFMVLLKNAEDKLEDLEERANQ